MPDIIITIDDVRRANHCVSGARRWFEAHDMDFRHFLRNGIPADEMVRRGDGLALRVVISAFVRRLTDVRARFE